jgi:hypothetical protein
MTEKEQVVMIRTILSFVEDIVKDGKKAPGPYGIANRLRMYMENHDKLMGGK